MATDTHFRDLIAKHLKDAEKKKQTDKIKVLKGLLQKYDSLFRYKGVLELIKNRNELEDYLEKNKSQISSVLKERERTALIGHKLEELVYQLFSEIATHFGLEIVSGSVLA